VHEVLDVHGSSDSSEPLLMSFAGVSTSVGPEPDPAQPGRHRFTVAIPLPDGPRGPQTLEISRRGETGEDLRLVRHVVAEPYEHPVAPTSELLANGGIAMATGPPDLSGRVPVNAPVRLGGWCFALSGIDRVRAILDGEREYELVYPTLRPDVWRALGRRDALLSGFELELDLTECPPGRHTLTVLATTTDGRTIGQAGEFECLEPTAAANEAMDLQVPAHDVDRSILTDALAAADDAWRSWAAAQAQGRRVLAIGGDRALLDAVGQTAAEVVVSDAALGALGHAGGAFELVIVTELVEDDGALDQISQVLAPGGALLARGGAELAGRMRARGADVACWVQRAALTTEIVPLGNPRARGAAPEASAPQTTSLDLAALADQDELQRLRLVVAERHAIVSTQESSVMALYHQELLRAHAASRQELVLRDQELSRQTERARIAERRLDELRASVSWRLTRPLRGARARAGRRSRSDQRPSSSE
jgi:hypothetical protein